MLRKSENNRVGSGWSTTFQTEAGIAGQRSDHRFGRGYTRVTLLLCPYWGSRSEYEEMVADGPCRYMGFWALDGNLYHGSKVLVREQENYREAGANGNKHV